MSLLDELAADSADAALVGATSLFAHWLDEHKDLEPDHTYAEVIVGVSLCLMHALATGQARGQGWRPWRHSLNHLRSFALGGAPIIVGELWQWRKRLAARARYTPPSPVEE